jgi:hypothetical protein
LETGELGLARCDRVEVSRYEFGWRSEAGAEIFEN